MNIINIYTDGSVKNNCGSAKSNVYGGIGIYSQELNLEYSEKIPNATNNKTELHAILKTLQLLEEKYNLLLNNPNTQINIYSDSMYSINCITKWYKTWEKNNWKTSNGKDCKNKELIESITNKLKKYNCITIKYIKGHANNEGNEIADKLARNCY